MNISFSRRKHCCLFLFLIAHDITTEFNGLIYRFQKHIGLFIKVEHLVI